MKSRRKTLRLLKKATRATVLAMLRRELSFSTDDQNLVVTMYGERWESF
jgi:hypothetical protein